MTVPKHIFIKKSEYISERAVAGRSAGASRAPREPKSDSLACAEANLWENLNIRLIFLCRVNNIVVNDPLRKRFSLWAYNEYIKVKSALHLPPHYLVRFNSWQNEPNYLVPH